MSGSGVPDLPRLHRVAAIIALASFLAGSEGRAQNSGYPNFGFRSYCNTGNRSANAGLAGYPTNNSFDSGLASFGYTTSGRVYSTQRSTAAAQQLGRQVNAIWSSMMNELGQRQPGGPPKPNQSTQQPSQPAGGLFPSMTKQEMLRIFLEGGTPQSGGGYAPAPAGNSSAATSTAYSNYQTAENEASKAYNAAQRVRYYDKDTWSRKNDASTAEYAANNADYAAQRAESAAYNGDSQARGYANLARQAANRARANANQARYNADTMR